MTGQQPMPRNQSSRAGFTLLEVMVALIIFSFGFIVLTELLSLGLQSIRKSEDTTELVLTARDLVEARLLDEELVVGETRGVTENGYRWTQSIENEESVGEENEDSVRVYRIKVRVVPPNPTAAGSYELETLKVVSSHDAEDDS